jgi:hypothetical protein
MGYRKTFNVFVALFLAMGIFSTTAFAEACFCGQACLHGLQPNSKNLLNFPFHKRCPDTLCKGCDLEKSQSLKVANNLAAQTPNIKILANAFILSALVDHPSHYHILERLDSFYGCVIAPSLPIYLQKSSLLC